MLIPEGYILQPRYIDQSDTMHEAPIVRELWFYLLRKVNHADNGKYTRGQGFFNLGDIAEDLHWWVGYRKMRYSKPQLTKSLRRLREGNLIVTTKATRGLVVTVCKYDVYQNPDNYESNGEIDTKETRRKRGGRTKNKNVKNKEKDTPQKGEALGNDFEKFWNDYHSITGKPKTDKEPALKHWKKLTEPEKAKAIESIKPWFLSINPEYCKKARTYLSDKNFNDELKPRQAKTSNYKLIN